MINDRHRMKKIGRVEKIDNKCPDDMFITCASFEERCLGSLRKFSNYSAQHIILFKFGEGNPVREKNWDCMLNIFAKNNINKTQYIITVNHGMTASGVLELHKYFKENILAKKPGKSVNITIDITTFTKELLLEVLFYLVQIARVENLRFLYTVPEKYASPDEGPLSHGIKNIKIIPFFWNRWSAIKDDMLVVILGYEEMRAWSLISKFDANINKLFITKPGSKKEWDTHCETFNKNLLNENYEKDTMPSLDPMSVVSILKEKIVDQMFHEKYNIFIAPFGTKPQLLGIFYFLQTYPTVCANIVSSTAIEHNTPYYSSGVGDTYCLFSHEITA